MMRLLLAVFSFTTLFAAIGFAAGLDGTYRLVKDSDGTVPKKNAVVTMTFRGASSGSVSMQAVQPGETVTDPGTFSVRGETITIQFKEMVWEAKNQPFIFDGCTLQLPFKALGGSEGPGTSTWLKQSPSCPEGNMPGVPEVPQNAPNTFSPAPEQAEQTKAASTEPYVQKVKIKSCGCTNIEDLEETLKDNLYLQGKFREKAADYQSAIDRYKGFGRSASPSILVKQFDDYAQWSKVELPAAFRKDRGYRSSMTVSPDARNRQSIDRKKLEAYIKTAACQGLVDDVIAHENYHIKITGEIVAGTLTMNTAAALSMEEVEAYAIGIQTLRAELDRLKATCKWKCIDKKPTPKPYYEYDDKKGCEQACRGGLVETRRLNPAKGRCDSVVIR